MDRRDFIKVGAGAFFVASADRVLGAGAPSNRVRLAIVGCRDSGRGQWVMRTAMKTPGAEIACVCDVDSRARDWAAALIEKETGVRPRKEVDFRRVLEDPSIDGVISETPDHFHAYSAIKAMRAGKAVYVEKPCGYCPRECELIIETQKRTGQVFQMGNQRRASLSYAAAIRLLQSPESPIGRLRWGKCWYMANRKSIGHGKPCAVPEWLDWDLWQGPAPRTAFHDNYVHYNWHWFRRWGTAETGNNAPHFADVARWALGGEYPELVTCTGGQLFDRGDDYEWPDTFSMSFNYPNGTYITYELTSRCNQNPNMGKSTALMIYGDGGCAMFDGSDSVTLFDEKGAEIRKWAPNGETVLGSLTNPSPGLDVMHTGRFVECVRTHDTRTNAPADQAAMSTLMPLLANIALDIRRPIELDPHTGALKTKEAAPHWAREYEKGWELC